MRIGYARVSTDDYGQDDYSGWRRIPLWLFALIRSRADVVGLFHRPQPDFVQQIDMFSSRRAGIEKRADMLNLCRGSEHKKFVARKQFGVRTWTRDRITLTVNADNRTPELTAEREVLVTWKLEQRG